MLGTEANSVGFSNELDLPSPRTELTRVSGLPVLLWLLVLLTCGFGAGYKEKSQDPREK